MTKKILLVGAMFFSLVAWSAPYPKSGKPWLVPIKGGAKLSGSVMTIRMTYQYSGNRFSNSGAKKAVISQQDRTCDNYAKNWKLPGGKKVVNVGSISASVSNPKKISGTKDNYRGNLTFKCRVRIK